MKDFLTLLYMACFMSCGWPAIARIIRRGSSADLSYWREILLLVGVCAQFTVMRMEGAGWHITISPVNTFFSVVCTLVAIWWYRHG